MDDWHPDFDAALAADLPPVVVPCADRIKAGMNDWYANGGHNWHCPACAASYDGADSRCPICGADSAPRSKAARGDDLVEDESGRVPRSELDRLGDLVEPDPSEAQKKSGNYRKGHVRWQGLGLTIETAAGQTRRGVATDGKSWETKLRDHYGYVRRTESEADGDHVDVFVPGDRDLKSWLVHVVNQNDPKTGRFDEHKCFLGLNSPAEAEEVYHRNYQDGWQGFDSAAPLTLPQFKRWLERGDTGMPLLPEDAEKLAGDFWDTPVTVLPCRLMTDVLALKQARKFAPGEDCPHCFAALERDPDSGKCNSCGKAWPEKAAGMPTLASPCAPGTVLTAAPWSGDVCCRASGPVVPTTDVVKSAHGPVSVAVDFDGTLAERLDPFDPDKYGRPRLDVIAKVNQLHEAGARIIVWTVRNSPERLRAWLRENNVAFDFINEQPDQPPNSSGKLFADAYVDDKAVSATDFTDGPFVDQLLAALAGDR